MTNFTLEELRSAINRSVRSVIDSVKEPSLKEMLLYHMGWDKNVSTSNPGGKRIRPVLVLYCALGAGASLEVALPFASSVELLHNFSLVHDDIQDSSPTRYGRETVWKKWGIPQAINAGDTLYYLAFDSILEADNALADHQRLEGSRLLVNTCKALTSGQFLDMHFETRKNVTLQQYWKMVEGKTAALISTCAVMGGLAANVNQESLKNLALFGNHLGLAFQVVDDLLGIWGDEEKIGKPNYTDLQSHKKTLPVIFGFENAEEFVRLWQDEPTDENINAMAISLENCGAKRFTELQAERHTDSALEALDKVELDPKIKQALIELTHTLLHRNR